MKYAVVLAMLVGCSSSESSHVSDAAGDGVASDVANDGTSDAASGCHVDTDCSKASFESCTRVEDPVCGGAAPLDQCANDADCADAGTGLVCIAQACGGHLCSPRCKTDTECGTGICDTTSGRCAAKPCATTADCPANDICGTEKRCVSKPCLADTDCMGFCVRSVCSASPGVCRAPAP